MMLSSLAPHIDGVLRGEDCDFNTLSTDTRTIESGALFVALRGENFDGHAYLDTAQRKGAVAAVVDTLNPNCSLPQLEVNDTTRALGKIAAYNRTHFSHPLVAITGSCGKTSVKGMLQSICELAGTALATRGNFNNHIGVPLTLMQLNADQQYAIIEAGTSGRGEIDYLAKLIQPDVALVNNIMPAHIAGFGSVEAIAEEKSALYRGDKLTTGVVNLDDSYAKKFIDVLANKHVIGFSRQALEGNIPVGVDRVVIARNAHCDKNGCWTFVVAETDLTVTTEETAITLQVPGEHSIANALAAAALARALNIDWATINLGLNKFGGVSGRMQPVSSSFCARLIDDSYNANPGSMRAAIDFLAHYEHSLLIAGDMGELGDSAEAEHAELGRYARHAGVKTVLAVGALSEHTAAGFGHGATWFATREQLLIYLNHQTTQQQEAFKKMTILIKGSRSAHMELVVNELARQGSAE
jgi:UDP-N-acetylmuramoyl-tripeptide--D-alanyl-D-alanine ligase